MQSSMTETKQKNKTLKNVLYVVAPTIGVIVYIVGVIIPLG